MKKNIPEISVEKGILAESYSEEDSLEELKNLLKRVSANQVQLETNLREIKQRLSEAEAELITFSDNEDVLSYVRGTVKMLSEVRKTTEETIVIRNETIRKLSEAILRLEKRRGSHN